MIKKQKTKIKHEKQRKQKWWQPTGLFFCQKNKAKQKKKFFLLTFCNFTNMKKILSACFFFAIFMCLFFHNIGWHFLNSSFFFFFCSFQWNVPLQWLNIRLAGLFLIIFGIFLSNLGTVTIIPWSIFCNKYRYNKCGNNYYNNIKSKICVLILIIIIIIIIIGEIGE